jgi:hypothetical protein
MGVTLFVRLYSVAFRFALWTSGNTCPPNRRRTFHAREVGI